MSQRMRVRITRRVYRVGDFTIIRETRESRPAIDAEKLARAGMPSMIAMLLATFEPEPES